MNNDMWQGLSQDLTNCLEKRNAELLLARKIIAKLITIIILGDKGKNSSCEDGVKAAREWLATYNKRVFPKTESYSHGTYEGQE